jgi:hypothetical protein
MIEFVAKDATSSIDRAQYSIDGGEWVLASPTNSVSDSPEEHYQITLHNLPLSSGEHTIAVRAYDRFENVGSAKTTTNVPTTKP